MKELLPHVPLRLLGNRVLVLRDQSPKKKGLIEIPDAYRETFYSGVVLRTGPGKEHVCPTCRRGQGYIETPVQRGDRVFWKRYAENASSGQGVKIPGFTIQAADGEERELVFLSPDTDVIGVEDSSASTGFRLLRDYVAVRRRDPIAEHGGIIVPDSAQKPENEGTIVAIGPGAHDSHGDFIASDRRVGEYVWWPEYAETVEPSMKRFETKKGEQIVLLMEHMIEHAEMRA